MKRLDLAPIFLVLSKAFFVRIHKSAKPNQSEVLLDQRVEMNVFPLCATLGLFTLITQLSCFEKCDQKELDIALQNKEADLLSIIEESCNIEEQQVQFLRSKTPTPELELLWTEQCPKSSSLSELMLKGKLQRRKEVKKLLCAKIDLYQQ